MNVNLTPAARLKLARAVFAGLAALCAFVIAQPDGTFPPAAKLAAGACAAVLAAMSPEILGGLGA